MGLLRCTGVGLATCGLRGSRTSTSRLPSDERLPDWMESALGPTVDGYRIADSTVAVRDGDTRIVIDSWLLSFRRRMARPSTPAACSMGSGRGRRSPWDASDETDRPRRHQAPALRRRWIVGDLLADAAG